MLRHKKACRPLNSTLMPLKPPELALELTLSKFQFKPTEDNTSKCHCVTCKDKQVIMEEKQAINERQLRKMSDK